jgi:hypothetical protein
MENVVFLYHRGWQVKPEMEQPRCKEVGIAQKLGKEGHHATRVVKVG